MSDYRLDCKGLQCPKPIIQISKKMREMTAGQTLEVEANDPAFPADLAAWLNLKGDMLLTIESRQQPLVRAVLVKA